VRAKPGMARRAEANAESVAARLFSRREKSEPKNQNGATRGRRAHDVRAVAALFTGREARATRVLRRDRETMGNTIANALNLPATMTRMMMFEGANLDEAMTAQAFANIEAAVGIPGIADHYQRALERYHFKQRKDAAGGMRPEDYLTMGSTYLWRSAEYNKDLGVGLQVAETVGGIVLNTVGNIIPGVGTGIWLAYNALKQSYMGSLKGRTRGAIAGYMSAGLTAFTSQFGVNAGVSYSYEDGWGGQVGVTLPIGDTSLSGSAGINFQEGEGITGTSVGAGYNFGGGSSNNPNTGYQGGIGLSFDQYGDFAGGNLNFGYGAQTEGNSALRYSIVATSDPHPVRAVADWLPDSDNPAMPFTPAEPVTDMNPETVALACRALRQCGISPSRPRRTFERPVKPEEIKAMLISDRGLRSGLRGTRQRWADLAITHTPADALLMGRNRRARRKQSRSAAV
jgi:hypothetical protein